MDTAILDSSVLLNRPFGATELTAPRKSPDKTFLELTPKFIGYAAYDLKLSPQTVQKYGESLKWVMKHLPKVLSPSILCLEDITLLKQRIQERGAGESRTNSILFALRKFLAYCQEIQKIATIINIEDIKPMKLPKRQVTFLDKEEIQQLLNSINVDSIYGLRMRALMELLLATGMRIGEALSLNRQDLDLKNLEVNIIGKGNKERTVYLKPRTIEWINKYLKQRTDSEPALFVAFGTSNRLTRHDLGKEFRRYAAKAGIKKKVTPHILRHSMATLMLHQGADIMFIKDILGHSTISTTAKYYLGTDKKKLKEAHEKYLKYD
ncbi:MAG: tyrosine-type recombinase/integrase [Candidatus Doudnabacteria bacterium]|nr:tyrosine-type recombinase/integrase [Candidatus Doudnabacteria bacterium]